MNHSGFSSIAALEKDMVCGPMSFAFDLFDFVKSFIDLATRYHNDG